MKIAVASLGDPRSVRTWSGIPAHMIKAMEDKQHEVTGIALKRPKEPWYYDWYRRLYYRVQGRWFLSDVEPYVLREIASQFDAEVNRIQPDVVIVIHGDFLAYTTFKQPAVIVHDATFASLLEYYPAFSNLTKRSVHAGNIMYQLALDRADAAVYSAKWASDSAQKDYNVLASKVYTIPLGANLVQAPALSNVQEWIEKRSGEEICDFLFLGVDWERKGGPDALRFVVELNLKGIKARLLVAGCSAIIRPEHEKYVRQLGFLRKDVKEEADQLEQLFVDSHALLLPSVAECYGCVYCEANAYGLPAIGRDTGGIPEIIEDGINGLLLKTGETPESLAERWAKIWLDKKSYVRISYAAREAYGVRLNYDAFMQKLDPILIALAEKNSLILNSIS